MTIRELTKNKLQKIWQEMKTLTPDQLSQELVELSALLGNFNEAMVDLEQKYIIKQLEVMEKEGLSVAKSEIKVKATPEYGEWKKCKELEKAMLETIRALKYRLRRLEDERETSYNL